MVRQANKHGAIWCDNLHNARPCQCPQGGQPTEHLHPHTAHKRFSLHHTHSAAKCTFTVIYHTMMCAAVDVTACGVRLVLAFFEPAS